MIISLCPKVLVDLHGVGFRTGWELQQFNMPLIIPTGKMPPQGFTDHGLVIYDNMEYYMTTYSPPNLSEEDECE